MIRKYFTEERAEPSGAVRGHAGLWSPGLGASVPGECVRQRHPEEEGVADGRHGSIWGRVAVLRSRKLRHSSPQKSGQERFCIPAETLRFTPAALALGVESV